MVMVEKEFEEMLKKSISKIKEDYPEYALFLDNMGEPRIDYFNQRILFSTRLVFITNRSLSFDEIGWNYANRLTQLLMRMCCVTRDQVIKKAVEQMIANGYGSERTDAGDKVILNTCIPEGTVIMNPKSYLKYTLHIFKKYPGGR